MNSSFLHPLLLSRFKEYLSGFHSNDRRFQDTIRLKEEHTFRVCEAAVDIGRSLSMSQNDLATAETCALLHDIGRFEQYSRYKTFSDSRSEDHAALGVKIIKENHMLNDTCFQQSDMIIRVISYHNRFSLPEEEDERCLLFAKLLRDADKIDIWYVVTEYYRSAKHNKNQAIELDLPDTGEISMPVVESLMNCELVRMADIRTLNDFKLLQIGWIYDINFPRSFRIIRKKNYLEKIRASISSESHYVVKVYEKAMNFLEKNACINSDFSKY